MNILRVARLLPWLSLAACPALLGHCGGATEHGTETGNPPVIEQRSIRLVAHPAGVQVVGDAGAVSPGANLRVTNQRTGQSAEGNARADGSLNVVVPGTLEDAYELSVTSGGSTESATLRVQPEQAGVGGTAGSGSGGPLDLASAACGALENALAQRLSDSFATANRACTVDADCASVAWSVGCYQDCGSSKIAASSVDAARAAASLASEDVCTQLSSRCERMPLPCEQPSSEVECRAGSCQALDLDSLSCQELSDKATQHRGAVLDTADRRCNGDNDCALVPAPLLSCAAGCNAVVAVSASIAEQLPSDLQRVEQTFCPSFSGRACANPPRTPCPVAPPDSIASCQQGRCEVSAPPR